MYYSGQQTPLIKLSSFFTGLCFLVVSANAFALSTGDIKIHTTLNEPLNATIPLDATKTELATLEVSLASEKTFKRIGMNYHPALDTMTVNLIKNNGAPHIKIISNRPMREPMLEFALLLRWGNGSILKEYPVMLLPATQ